MTLRLIDRLRGIYILPVNDGAGLLDGKDTFTRNYPTHPLLLEAADMLEAQDRGETVDAQDIIDRLSEPLDLMGLGLICNPPICTETIIALMKTVD